MQTVQFQIEDNKLDNYTVAYMKTNKFQEDKAYFQKCLEDFDNGKTTALSYNEVWEQIDNHTKRLCN